MNSILTNIRVFGSVAALFVAATATQVWYGCPETTAVPQEITIASGPTLPPGPWDEGKEVNVASGPTLPPGPWDEGKEVNVASGPTLPPGPWDEGKEVTLVG